MPSKLIILLGPTAVGKTDYSLSLAKKYNSPIISCDSRQIYKEMSIGTAVPSAEQLSEVQHYFIQSHSVQDIYTAGKYEVEALSLIEKLFDSGHETLIMTGGSMFYIDAICKGLDDLPDGDPVLRKELLNRLELEGLQVLVNQLTTLDPKSIEQIDINNPRRVLRALEVCLQTGKTFSSFKTSTVKKRSFDIEKRGISRSREDLRERIAFRVDKMIEEGLYEEVKSVYQYRDLPALNTVGYKEMFDHIDGILDFDDAVQNIKHHTWAYAKRQLTWWKRDKDIQWLSF